MAADRKRHSRRTGHPRSVGVYGVAGAGSTGQGPAPGFGRSPSGSQRQHSAISGNTSDQRSPLSTPAKCKSYCRKLLAFLFSHVGLCALVVGYAIGGALLFRRIESPYEDKLTTVIEVQLLTNKTLDELWDITASLNVFSRVSWSKMTNQRLRAFELELVKRIKTEGYDGTTQVQWSFSGAFLYALTIITTIGYGNIAPTTELGKIMTIFYAIFGIPLMLLYLTNIGGILAKSFRFVYGKFCTCQPIDTAEARRAALLARSRSIRQRTRLAAMDLEGRGGLGASIAEEVAAAGGGHADGLDHFFDGKTSNVTPKNTEKVHVPISLSLVLLIIYVTGGGFLFSLWEGWNLLQGSYFCFISLSTIGFGDLVPGNSVVNGEEGLQERMVICSLYLLTGLALIAMCFNLMQEEVVHNVRTIGKRIGIINDSEEEEYEEEEDVDVDPVDMAMWPTS
ncbi:TWiK family of potassium channels protein 7 [Halotydeus destructor]|nr:TWiK family of potassium channels protein 7 [Halotydeus destructor]